MLKNKKAIYLLIPLNIAVWGFFVYRFWMAYHEGDAPASDAPMQVSALKSLKDSVTYKLALDYKDPFLKEGERGYYQEETPRPVLAATQVVNHPAPTPVKTPTVAPKPPPEIKYLGLIKNTHSGLTTALISVNGQSRLIKPNESIDGFLFKSITKDSLVANYGKEKIVVMK